ncbi:hypothetical protein ASS64_13320 [Erythrobacter sp. AP23]|nr:hypothetical protein ASS64_13320 [Erythrobacter sp. AP23]
MSKAIEKRAPVDALFHLVGVDANVIVGTRECGLPSSSVADLFASDMDLFGHQPSIWMRSLLDDVDHRFIPNCPGIGVDAFF